MAYEEFINFGFPQRIKKITGCAERTLSVYVLMS